MLIKYLGNTNHVLIIQFCHSSFRGQYKWYITKVIEELVNINSMIRDRFFNAGCWVGEIKLVSYNSMVRDKVFNANITDKIRVTMRYQNIQSVTQYVSRATDTLNKTATLKNLVKPRSITPLNIQMNIYVTTNYEISSKCTNIWRKCVFC